MPILAALRPADAGSKGRREDNHSQVCLRPALCGLFRKNSTTLRLQRQAYSLIEPSISSFSGGDCGRGALFGSWFCNLRSVSRTDSIVGWSSMTADYVGPRLMISKPVLLRACTYRCGTTASYSASWLGPRAGRVRPHLRAGSYGLRAALHFLQLKKWYITRSRLR